MPSPALWDASQQQRWVIREWLVVRRILTVALGRVRRQPAQRIRSDVEAQAAWDSSAMPSRMLVGIPRPVWSLRIMSSERLRLPESTSDTRPLCPM